MIHITYNNLEQVQSLGLFHGFDIIVVLVVIAQAMTGFVVSMMLKYADAVLKGFAISVAVIVASVASLFLFHTKLHAMFFVGASLVAISVKMYSYYGPDRYLEEGAKTSTRNTMFGGIKRQRLIVVSILILGVITFLLKTDETMKVFEALHHTH